MALVDSSIEEPAIRVHGRGRGRGKAKGRVHGRVAPAIDEVSIEDVLVNENPPRNMKRWKRMRILRRLVKRDVNRLEMQASLLWTQC